MTNPLVVTPGVIYVLVDEREDFDKIGLPAVDNGPQPRWHVRSKTLEQDGVCVIFQHWTDQVPESLPIRRTGF